MGKRPHSPTPFSLLLILLHLLLLSKVHTLTLEGSLPPEEVEALNIISSKLEMNPSKHYTEDACIEHYNGIICNCSFNNNTVCHVTTIGYGNEDLNGIIPPELGNLTFLKEIELSNNKLHGSIPESLGNLSHLVLLDLSDNDLTGSIPPSFGGMHKLDYLVLDNNYLTGPLPPSLGALPYLYYLSLNENQLSGPIPDELGNITNLRSLNLRENNLSGVLPLHLGNLKNLVLFRVAQNEITGELPASFVNLTNLKTFSISGNNVSGSIPGFIENWKQLRQLSLMGNNFEGPLPREIFTLERLDELWVTDLRRGSKGFPLPPVSRLRAMKSLILRNCLITGQIPEDIFNMPNLTYLDLSFNNLTGEIPKSATPQKLDHLYLTGNMLTGPIPGWIPDSVKFNMDLSYNNFTNVSFTQPHNKSNMNLFSCCSSTSNLTSPSQIMDSHCHDKKSKYHSLYINCGGESTTINGKYYEADLHPYGTSAFYVSPEGNWAYSSSGDFVVSSLRHQDYRWNMTHRIPVHDSILYETARFSPLSLKYYGFCLREGNYTVRLHFAEILFADDKDHSNTGKRMFDVFIQGERVLKDFNIKHEAGGPSKVLVRDFTAIVKNHLLEIHFYWAGKGSTTVPPRLYGPLISAISVTPDFKTDSGRKLSGVSIAGIAVASFVVVFLLVLAFIKRMGWLERKELRDDELKGIQLQDSFVTFRQIVDATQNFSSEKEIGKGGFGTVYKAELQNGNVLAVKKLSLNSKQGNREFVNEVGTLSSLKHENLVQLLGCYSGENQLLLVYEYMENNSLASVLFGQQSTLKLNWQTRHKICLGIAKGLAYLHEESRLKIVHRDIKATNILLDKDLKAKISDFGLAKLYDAEHTHIVTKIAGTHGYMAPEYAMRGILTEKVDIYSFGVLTLEIVSGKNNAEYRPNEESVFLLDLAYISLKKGNLLDLVDKSVIYESGYSEKQATTMLNLAMLCTDQSPAFRPTMADVVKILEGKKTIQRFPSSHPAFWTHDSESIKAYSDINLPTETTSISSEVTSNAFSSYFNSKV